MKTSFTNIIMMNEIEETNSHERIILKHRVSNNTIYRMDKLLFCLPSPTGIYSRILLPQEYIFSPDILT